MTLADLIPSLARAAARFARGTCGGVAVEFAAVAPALVLMAGGGLELSTIYLAKAQLELMAQRGARMVMTRQAMGYTSQTFSQVLCANSAVVNCPQVAITVSPQTSCSTLSTTAPTVTYDNNGNITSALTYNTGSPSNLMVLQVFYAMPVPGGSIFGFATSSSGYMLLASTQVFPNEP